MNLKPEPKVAAAGAGGAAGVVLIWLASLFGLDLPVEVATALVTVLAFGAGWLKKD